MKEIGYELIAESYHVAVSKKHLKTNLRRFFDIVVVKMRQG